MPGWKGSTRKSRLPKDWPRRRNHVLKRDGYQCTATQIDGARCRAKATDVDHIIADSEGGSDEYENLTSLCGWHHLRKSSSEGGAASAATRKKRQQMILRQPERHPGMLEKPRKKNARPRT